MIIFTVRNHTCTIAFTIYCVFHVITIDVDLEDGVEDDTTESHHVTDCAHVVRKMNGSNHRVSNKNKDYLKIATEQHHLSPSDQVVKIIVKVILSDLKKCGEQDDEIDYLTKADGFGIFYEPLVNVAHYVLQT